MSSFVAMSGLVTHIYSIKHTFKHLSSGHWEASSLQSPVLSFSHESCKGQVDEITIFLCAGFQYFKPRNT